MRTPELRGPIDRTERTNRPNSSSSSGREQQPRGFVTQISGDTKGRERAIRLCLALGSDSKAAASKVLTLPTVQEKEAERTRVVVEKAEQQTVITIISVEGVSKAAELRANLLANVGYDLMELCKLQDPEDIACLTTGQCLPLAALVDDPAQPTLGHQEHSPREPSHRLPFAPTQESL
ncbi:Prohibitin [Galemys pyrenaicus]|uniref:Prohibitin n=1 Tax=Galemys pyrenaicus TaxID=202257 RepID=A0A8J6ALR0_GALPY|nr:Prohibitin [Galemys pyrenaicus]